MNSVVYHDLPGREAARRRFLRQCGGAVAAWPLARLAYGRPDTGQRKRDASDAHRLAGDIERILWEQIVPAWYPRCLDRDQGGFWENFSEDWARGPVDSKFLVYQARMTWTPAALALSRPGDRERLLGYARHGLRFLKDKMWDARYGGFVEWTDVSGRPARDKMPWKQMYSLAFGVYAAATTYQATEDPDALELARSAFDWIDQHAHDSKYGGYFEHLTADGQPVAKDMTEEKLGDGLPLIGHIGHKSMNAHIHVLEALISLRRVWDDARLTDRLTEVFQIVRDKIVMPGGHLNMFCSRDFTPKDERSSFGHELEIAYLLMEATHWLDGDDDAATHQTIRQLVAHALRWGWDPHNGGFYDEGPPTGEATRRNKVWWVQPEGMNGLLTAAQLFPDEPIYFRRFCKTWDFFRDHMIDHRHGGCFDSVDPAGKPLKRHKASPWKTAYHVTRAMVNAARQLKKGDLK